MAVRTPAEVLYGKDPKQSQAPPLKGYRGVPGMPSPQDLLNKAEHDKAGGLQLDFDLFPDWQKSRDRPTGPSRSTGLPFSVAQRTPRELQAERAAQTEFRNTSRRLINLGLKDQLVEELENEAPSSFETLTDPIFDAMLAFNYAATGYVDELLTHDIDSEYEGGNAGRAFQRAVTEFASGFGIGDKGEEGFLGTPQQLGFGEVINRHGDIAEEDRWATAAVGFALDVLLDVTTYTGLGLFKATKILRGVDDIPLLAEKFKTGARMEAYIASSAVGKGFRRKFMANSLVKGLSKGENADELAQVMNELAEKSGTFDKTNPITAEQIQRNASQFLIDLSRKNTSVERQSVAMREEIISLTANMNEAERRLMGGYLLEKINTQTGEITGAARSAIDGLNIDDAGKKFIEKNLRDWSKIFRKYGENEVKVGLLSEGMLRGTYAFGVQPVTGRSARFFEKFARIRFGDRGLKYLRDIEPGYRLTSETAMLSGAHRKAYPNLEARLLDAFQTETDIALMGARRGLESIRKVSTKKLYDTVLSDTRFAMPIDGAIVKNVNDPMHIQLKKHGMDFFTLPAFNSFDEGKSAYYALPSAMVEHLKEAQKVLSGDDGLSAFMRTYKEALGIWKAYALLSPGYHMRNMYSNVFNNWLGGVSNPARYMESFVLQVEDTANLPGPVRSVVENVMGGRKTIDDLKFKLKDGTTVTGRQFKEEALEEGVMGGGQIGVEQVIGVEQDMLRLGNSGRGWFDNVLTSVFKRDRIPASVLEGGMKGWKPRDERVNKIAGKIFSVSQEGGGTVTEEGSQRLAELYDVIARGWAYRNSKTPDEWYTQFIHDFQPGLPPGFSLHNMNPNVFAQEQALKPTFFSRTIRFMENSFAHQGSINAKVLLQTLRTELGRKGGSKAFKNVEYDQMGVESYLKEFGDGQITREELEMWTTNGSTDFLGNQTSIGQLQVFPIERTKPGEPLDDNIINFMFKAADLEGGYDDGIVNIVKKDDGTVRVTSGTSQQMFEAPSIDEAREMLKARGAAGKELHWVEERLPGGHNDEEWLMRWGNNPGEEFRVGSVQTLHDPLFGGNTDAFVHFRTQDRFTEAGERVFVIQEKQSDWSQALHRTLSIMGKEYKALGMKRGVVGDTFEVPDTIMKALLESGPTAKIVKFTGPPQDLKAFNRMVDEWQLPSSVKIKESPSGLKMGLIENAEGEIVYRFPRIFYGRGRNTERSIKRYLIRNKLMQELPATPFKDNDVWAGVAMKQILRLAAERGYSRVAWLKNAEQVKYAQHWTDKVAKTYEDVSDGILRSNKKIASMIDGLAVARKWGSKVEDVHFPIVLAEVSPQKLAEDVKFLVKESLVSEAHIPIGVRDELKNVFASVGQRLALDLNPAAFVKAMKEQSSEELREALETFLRPKGKAPIDLGAFYSISLSPGARKNIIEESFPVMQKKGGRAIGATTFDRLDGSALINAAEGNNASTFIHELAHVIRRGMIDIGDEQTLNRWVFGDKVYKKAVAEDTPLIWKRPQEEKFARAIEQFVTDGIPPHGAGRAMEGTFDSLRGMMQDVYQHMDSVGPTLDKNSQEVVRRILGRGVEDQPENLSTAKALVEAAGEMTSMDEPIADKLRRLLGNNWATRLNQDLGRKMEDNGRLAHYIQKRMDGFDPAKSTASVKRFLFDYSELTPFERDYLKAVIPFYTWARKNIPLQFQEIIKQPERYARLPKAMNEIEAIAGDNDKIPQQDYFAEVNATRLPWNSNNQPMFIAQDLPFQDLNRLNLKDALSQMTPFLRIWAELLPPKGHNYFLEQPIESFSGEPNTIDIFGANTELPWGKKLEHGLEQMIPPLGKARRFFRKIEQGRGGEQVLRELLGVSAISVDVDAVVRGNRYMKREVARRVQQKLKKRIEEFGFEEGLRRSRED